MSENFMGEDDLKLFFRTMLGVNTELSVNIDNNDEAFFIEIITSLEKTIKLEEIILIEGGIDLAHLMDPIWLVVEKLISGYYGEEPFELIMWYLFYRYTQEGTSDEWVDELDGKSYKIKNKKDLWKFISYNYLGNG